MKKRMGGNGGTGSSNNTIHISEEQKATLATWIEYVIEQPLLDTNDLFKSLKDGTVLCQLIATVKPIKFPMYQREPKGLPFKELENIAYFMQNCKEYGVKCDWTFGDLHKGRNINLVLASLMELSDSAKALLETKPTVQFRGPFWDQNNPLPAPFDLEQCRVIKGALKPRIELTSTGGDDNTATTTSPTNPARRKTIIAARRATLVIKRQGTSTPALKKRVTATAPPTLIVKKKRTAVELSASPVLLTPQESRISEPDLIKTPTSSSSSLLSKAKMVISSATKKPKLIITSKKPALIKKKSPTEQDPSQPQPSSSITKPRLLVKRRPTLSGTAVKPASATPLNFSENAQSLFTRMQEQDHFKFLVFHIQNNSATSLDIEVTGDYETTFTEFVECLPENGCRFGIFKMNSINVFVSWNPAEADKQLMDKYSISTSYVKQQLSNYGPLVEVNTGSIEDLSESAIIHKCIFEAK